MHITCGSAWAQPREDPAETACKGARACASGALTETRDVSEKHSPYLLTVPSVTEKAKDDMKRYLGLFYTCSDKTKQTEGGGHGKSCDEKGQALTEGKAG